jgi:hypothetical protein
MTEVILYCLCLVAVVVALRSVSVLRATSYAHSGPIKFVLVVSTVGGVLFQSEALPKSTLSQLAIVGSAMAAALLVSAHHETASSSSPGAVRVVVMILVLWMILFLVNATMNAALSDTSVFGRLLPLGYWLSMLLVVSNARIDRRMLAHCMALALAVATVASLAVPSAFRSCDQFKCGVIGAIYTGPFSSENYLALLTALTLVAMHTSFAATDSMVKARLPLYVLTVGSLLASSSRTSMLAAVVGMLVAMLLGRRIKVARSDCDKPMPSSAITTLASVAPFFVATGGLILLYNVGSTEFSNRGRIWGAALQLLSGHELFGLGIGRWTGYVGISEVSRHFPHSVYLLTYFSGGILSVAVFMGVLSTAVHFSQRTAGDFVATTAYVATFCVIGAAEVNANLMTVDGLIWTLLFLVSGAVVAPRSDATAQLTKDRHSRRPSSYLPR